MDITYLSRIRPYLFILMKTCDVLKIANKKKAGNTQDKENIAKEINRHINFSTTNRSTKTVGERHRLAVLVRRWIPSELLKACL